MQSAHIAYEMVRERIVSAVYAPRQVLREAEVAADLGLSRTPVREALARLAAEGLVNTRPQVGAQVADLTIADVDELFSIRERLECLSLSYACRRMPRPDLTELRSVHAESVLAQQRHDVPALIELNTTFHRQLFALAERPRLMAMLALIHDNLVRYRTITLYDEDERENSVAEHGALLDLLDEGDEVGLYSMIGRHLRRPYRTLRRQIESESDSSKAFEVPVAVRARPKVPFRAPTKPSRKSSKGEQ